ncbi:hypothetical protein FIBSPDRAFT_813327 [Athelia psychrophila]|uniref:Uncharacterized protein n=1 Tax=Athelia psychrophila TaxID=1759441 RepID=A0A166UIK3_9AGAM|nr:hypothetical protein FIBSPDRAFT_813327 [Fibularhizoctonia sp. CBS 109695]
MTTVIQHPPELLLLICAHVYSSGLPAATSSLDPLVVGDYGTPTAQPSTLPAGNWSEPITRKTLSTLCLVNHAWYEAAKPWLWQKVEIRLPRSWLAFVEEVAGGDDEEANEEQAALAIEKSIQAATGAALARTASMGVPHDARIALRLQECILAELSGPDGSIPPELLSPPASREPSPRRLRTKSKSPARWKMMRSISDAVQSAFQHSNPGLYIQTPQDTRPGRFVYHLDFNHFRTIGMRRSVDEGVNSRFVTGDRVEAVLKELPNLVTFGATEYMDGALNLAVLKELFLRGSPSRGRGRPSRGRELMNPDYNDAEEQDRERRRDCKDLEAVDLTGCISAVFVNALTDFVNEHLVAPEAEAESSEDEDYRREGRRARFARTLPEEPLVLPGLQRLGLRGVKSIQPHVLHLFVLSFPSLTHLDLSGTRAEPELLYALGASDTLRLHSLALARCIRLTGQSIRDFLIQAPAASQIRELTLYGDRTFTCPLLEHQLHEIFTLAPCFTSGELVYLDLSSAPVSKTLLADVIKPQLKLRSLGLSYIPDLELSTVSAFILAKAPNVEVLTLLGTSPELEHRGLARKASVALHTKLIRPLCTPPFVFTLSTTPAVVEPPTRVRVIELSIPILNALGAGAGAWRIVRSKGGRGWYVDTASGWVGGALKRDLGAEDPLRAETERLADANGNVSSGVGWHARKMEVLHGYGMLGREDGLYGAVSFAYQG